jgi:hypothetical protein
MNLYQVTKHCPGKRDSVIMSLFLQKWFVNRIKDENNIFKEEFFIE